jgi:glycosyltransferase involved in cell wall biosynthesis
MGKGYEYQNPHQPQDREENEREMSLRVAILTRDYPPDIGGIPKHVYNLARKLRELSVDVEVFKGSSDAGTLLAPLRKTLREGDHDLIHIQSLPYAMFAPRKPLVVTVHSPVLEEGKYYTGVRRVKRPLAIPPEVISTLRADAIIAVSMKTESDLRRLYAWASAKRIYRIPNGVDTELFRPGSKPEGKAVITMASRLDRRKNIEEVLTALSRVHGEYELHIVGEGPEKPRLQRIATALGVKASFTGRLDEHQLAERLANTHIFISSSLSEGFGLSLLEAMAASCCVIASNIPAHRELIENNRDGLLYTGVNELTKILSELVKDLGRAKTFGEAARAKALRYSWDIIARKTRQVYEAVLGEAGSL